MHEVMIQAQDWAAKLRAWWCVLMHESAMWPIHGDYRCRTCGLRHPIPWAGAESVPQAAPPLHSIGLTRMIPGTVSAVAIARRIK
jgi:hypothetical protein